MAARNDTLHNSPFTGEGPAFLRPGATPGGTGLLTTKKAPTLSPRQLRERQGRLKTAAIWTVFLLLGGGAVAEYQMQPATVETIRPQMREITESIAASGQVGGYREVTVGSPVSGIVSEIRVKEGQRVKAGQVLAAVEDSVVSAQVRQARQAMWTAEAAYFQQVERPLPSEIQSLRSAAEQARMTYRQREDAVQRAETAILQAEHAAMQAFAQSASARAAADKASAQRDLAKKNWERLKTLYSQGAVPEQNADQAKTNYIVADREVEASGAATLAAAAAQEQARAAMRGAEQDAMTARDDAVAAKHAWDAAEENLKTLQAQPRKEVIALAHQKGRDAEKTLEVAEAQVQDTLIRAPFAGIVTTITGQPGASVTAAGVVHLIGTDAPEIRIQTDENNLGSLHTGQNAVITSAAYPGAKTTGKVRRIGAQVDSASGTVEVAIGSNLNLPWLRPGQTVNVNLITSPHVTRILIPSSSIKLMANGSAVFLMKDGRATLRRVTLGSPTGSEVPVLSGLPEGASAVLLRIADGIHPGQRIRAKATR